MALWLAAFFLTSLRTRTEKALPPPFILMSTLRLG